MVNELRAIAVPHFLGIVPDGLGDGNTKFYRSTFPPCNTCTRSPTTPPRFFIVNFFLHTYLIQ
jgi:hypothetical protein